MPARYLESVLATLAIVIFAVPALAQECVPELLSTYDTPSTAFDVVALGSVVVVGDGHGGLQILDMSDPRNPAFIASQSTQDGAEILVLHGDVLFIAETNGFSALGFLQAFDLSDPSNPAHLRTIALGKKPMGMAIDGNMLYLSVNEAFADFGEVLLYDITDPSDPELRSTIALPSTQSARGADAAEGILYAASASTFSIHDVSDPSNPAILGLTTLPEIIWRVAVADGYAYLTVHEVGLHVVDVRDPTNPTLVAVVDIPGVAWDVTISDQIAYVSHRDSERGVRVIDISVPEEPTELGSFLTKQGNPLGIFCDGSILYTACAGGGLHTLDISDCARCPADLDGDTDLDADDFFLYLDAFASGDLNICDIDQDADCDAEDFFAYLDLFAAGC